MDWGSGGEVEGQAISSVEGDEVLIIGTEGAAIGEEKYEIGEESKAELLGTRD